jgi:hypothetical protein
VIRRVALVLVAGVLLASCGTQSPTAATRQWRSQSGFLGSAKSLVGDVTSSTKALRTVGESVANLHTVCGVLLVETEAANSSLPTPDAQLNRLLATAYNELGEGANVCYTAGSSLPARARAIGYLEMGTASLYEAAARLSAVAGN